MSAVVGALARALPYLFLPRVLLMVALPVVAALVLWGVLAAFFWEEWAAALGGFLRMDAVAGYLAKWDLQWLASGSVAVLLFVLLVPATLFTALFVIAVIASPLLLEIVARREFPDLERRHGGTNLGSVGNALGSFAIYIALWVVSLPLWLIPPLALVVPLVLTAWLNQRLFRYDALAEHASPEERDRVIDRSKARLYVLGLAVALLQFVPIVNLVAPLYAALVFIVFCLSELSLLRRTSAVQARSKG